VHASGPTEAGGDFALLRIVPAFDREIRHSRPLGSRCGRAAPQPGPSAERSNDSHNRGTPPGLAIASPANTSASGSV
jgi:hypothetical protein